MDINRSLSEKRRDLYNRLEPEESSIQKQGLERRPLLSHISACTKDYVFLKSYLKILSKFSNKAGNEVTKSLINDLQNTGLLKGFHQFQDSYTSESTGILFDIINENLNGNTGNLMNIVFDKSLKYEKNCAQGSKEEYYSYWICMRFDKWIDNKINKLVNQ